MTFETGIQDFPWKYSVAEEEALTRSALYVRCNYVCPTCRGEGTYRHNGESFNCPKDLGGQCIQWELLCKYIVGNIPWDFMTLDWVDFLPPAKSTVDDYILNLDRLIPGGIGLYIHSVGLGTGKTFASTHILKEAAKQGFSVYFCPFFDILDLHNSPYRRYVEDKLQSSDLIVIDDIVIPRASEKQANFFEMTLERIIRHRVHNGLSTIVTSNMTMRELEDYYGRIFSLLSQSSEGISLEKVEDNRIVQGAGSRVNGLLLGETRPIT